MMSATGDDDSRYTHGCRHMASRRVVAQEELGVRNPLLHFAKAGLAG